jgi:hypothetical protein
MLFIQRKSMAVHCSFFIAPDQLLKQQKIVVFEPNARRTPKACNQSFLA